MEHFSFFDEISSSKQNSPASGAKSVCLCPIKGTQGLNELISCFVNPVLRQNMSHVMSKPTMWFLNRFDSYSFMGWLVIFISSLRTSESDLLRKSYYSYPSSSLFLNTNIVNIVKGSILQANMLGSCAGKGQLSQVFHCFLQKMKKILELKQQSHISV